MFTLTTFFIAPTQHAPTSHPMNRVCRGIFFGIHFSQIYSNSCEVCASEKIL
jgi:hypothetical protein